MQTWLNKVVSMYVDGFRSMTVGRKLWLLIIIKLFIFFAILKLFFFPDILHTVQQPTQKGPKPFAKP